MPFSNSRVLDYKTLDGKEFYKPVFDFKKFCAKHPENYFKDVTSAFIQVPCGHCPQCIARKQTDMIQRVHMESLFNYLFFCTLTYNQDSLPIRELNGFNISFADISDVQNMFKRIRKRFSLPFRYTVTSEFGSKHGRPHFHLLISVPKNDNDTIYTPYQIENHLQDLFLSEWRRNYGSSRSPLYHPLCTYYKKWIGNRLSYNFDLHYIEPLFSDGGVADVGFYVMKYMLKPSPREEKLYKALKLNLDTDKFLYDDTGNLLIGKNGLPVENPFSFRYNWRDIRSKFILSKGFGLLKQGQEYNPKKHKIYEDLIEPKVRSHIRKGIEFGKKNFDYPVFLHPRTGQTFPLSSYYQRYFLSAEDKWYFYMNSKSPYVDAFPIADDTPRDLYQQAMEKYQRQCNIVEQKEFF